ncbi:MAG: efflux RND transporter permease subunit [Alphaproteobacteria bacterium]
MTLFFDNRRLLILTILIVLVGGLSALFTMPQEEDPKITNRFATIVTPFPGASASRVEALVTEKIENELREISQIEEIESTSRTGLSLVTVELKDTIYNTDGPFAIVRDALADAERNFPVGVPSPEFDDDRTYPFTLKVALTWEADSAPNLLILKRIAEDLQDRLRNIPGTEFVDIFGAPQEEVVVSINAAVVESLGLSRQDIAAAIANADSKVAAGQFRGNRNEYVFEVRGELDSLSRLREVPIRQDDSGAIVRVGDVGRVDRRLVSPPDQLARVDGRPAVVVATRLESNLRVGDWTAQVRERISAFEDSVSDGIGVKIIFDQSSYSDERFASLINNLLIGAGLVVAVLFVTLGWRSSLIVASAIPLTGLASLVALNVMGYPINQMSITGLIVALGLLVDAAIVMTDAIRRRLIEGLSPREAVRVSVARLWVPLFSSTFTTVLAFTPIILLPGAVGEFVGPIAASVISMLVLSLILALTVGAALSGDCLPGGLRGVTADRVPFWVGGISIPPLGRAFRSVLTVSLKAPLLSIMAALILPVLGFIALPTLPDAFFPEADRNQFQVQLRLSSQRSIEETVRVVERAHELLIDHAEIESVQWYLGTSAAKYYYNLPSNQDGVGNFADAMVTTRSLRGMYDLINEIQDELNAAFPDAQFIARQLLQGPPVSAPVELRIFGEDLKAIQALGEQARLILSEIPQIVHTTASIAGGEPKLWLNADQDDARQAGLSLVDIAGALDAQLEGTFGGTIVEGSEELRVRVRLDDEARSRFDELASLYVLTPGSPVTAPGTDSPETLVDFQATPISALGDIVLEPEASSITRFQGERVNTVLGYIKAGTLPSTALEQFRRMWEEADIDMPPGTRLSIGGDAEARSNAVGALLASVGLIVVLMVTTVVLTFNSFRLSGIVFSVAFLSMGLGVLALALFDFPFGFQPLIGIIGLIGVAINAAIIILSALRLDPGAIAGDIGRITDTVVEASRHIVSTTLTTFGGFLPLILSEGGFWPPFATAIAVGVLLSTVISFFFVPQAFLIITRLRPVDVRAGLTD